MVSDGEFEVANQGVKELRRGGLADDSVIPFLGESEERFRGHAIEGNQGFVCFGISGRIVIKIRSEIFDPGEGVTWVVRAVARISGGGRSIGSLHTMGGGSKDGKGCGEHNIWGWV